MFPLLRSPALSAKDTQMWLLKPSYFSYDDLDMEEQELKNCLADVRELCNNRDLLSMQRLIFY
jgi:hypothetical protein